MSICLITISSMTINLGVGEGDDIFAILALQPRVLFTPSFVSNFFKHKKVDFVSKFPAQIQITALINCVPPFNPMKRATER